VTPRGAPVSRGRGRLWRRPRLWSRLGLRGRVTLLFTLGAFCLSVLMGSISYFTARHYLVGGRVSTSVQQAYSNAQVVRTTLAASSPDPNAVLDSPAIRVSAPNSVLVVDGVPASTSLLVQESTIPAALRALVGSGTPGSETFLLAGQPAIAVGVPIIVPGRHASYFEVFDLSDLQHTLSVLALALVAAGLITTVLGALVGRRASLRSLRPLVGVSRAAVAIANGRLDTRLPAAVDDPDLVGLTSSFNRMVDQLQERIQRETRFTSDVSHELRSPLTTLSATLEVLEAHRDELSGRARQALSLLGDDLRRFQRMVSELLEISRSDTGSVDVVLEEVEVGELVQRAVEAGARSVPGLTRPPPVDIDGAVRHARLQVDKRRFERVMANLLENAALYGGGPTRVTVGPARAARNDARPRSADPVPPIGDASGRPAQNRLAAGGPAVRIAVEDRGPGVPETERDRVFERFYRGQAAGRRGRGTGTGLGLSLVAEHVRVCGGAVWVEEAEGGGARFVIELPLGDEPVALQGPPGSDEPGRSEEPGGFTDGRRNVREGAGP